MGVTLSAISDILKNQYLGPIREQLNNDIVLLSRLEKDDESVVGKNFTIPLHIGRNEGIGATTDGGTLPTAGNQSYKETIVPMRYLYGRIQLTGPSMKASRSNEGAFVRALESEMRGLARDLKSDLNRQLFGDGSGLLATGASASTVNITVDSTAKLRVGMKVDILVKATGATTAGVVGASVASITSATVFVVDTAPATPASIDNTYGVYRSGARNLEIMGLGGIVTNADPASGALQGLAVASYPVWKASILANSGTPRAISESLMQTAIDTVSQAGDGEVSAIYTTFGVRRAYQALLTTGRQYVNTMDLKGGAKAIAYDNMPIIADKNCPANKMYFIDENALKFYRLSDFDWMQEDGAVLSRVSGSDAYEATMFLYSELGCSARNAHCLLSDITEA
jgi:hypothetical protein